MNLPFLSDEELSRLDSQ
jgi:hypothetical protein